MAWTHRTAVVNGIHIHYVTHGHGAPVILLHGWPEFWYGWRQQIPVLGERFEVIVPDMRGFGYSDKPLTGYDTRTAASDIYELARLLGHQRVALVAHDIGARVAYRFTLDHEDMVSRLAVLTNGVSRIQTTQNYRSIQTTGTHFWACSRLTTPPRWSG